MKSLFGFIFFTIFLFFGQDAYAQKRQSIDFEDQLIEGQLRNPELAYLLKKKQFNFGRLIKLRENFLSELRKTSEQVQRGGE